MSDPRPDGTDDALLEALGALAREQEADGVSLADLEALAAADDPVSAADRAAFDALLAGDPEAAALLDRLAGPAPVDRFAEAARAAFAAADDAEVHPTDGGEREAPAAAPAPKPAASRAEPSGAGAKILPFRRRTVAVLGAVLAIAAALVVFVARPAPPLPGYAASITGGRQIVRGVESADTPTLGPDDRLNIVLTPDVPVDVPVAVVAFILEPNGEARRWMPPAEISPQGAVRIAGTGRELGLVDGAGPPREVMLRVFVGRADAGAPDDDTVRGPWRGFDVAVRITP